MVTFYAGCVPCLAAVVLEDDFPRGALQQFGDDAQGIPVGDRRFPFWVIEGAGCRNSVYSPVSRTVRASVLIVYIIDDKADRSHAEIPVNE